MTTSSTTHQNPATYTPRIFPPDACPAWCINHTGFPDGSEDWHEGRTVKLHGFEFYVSTGTITGEPELFMPREGSRDGMPLDEVRELAEALLALLNEVR